MTQSRIILGLYHSYIPCEDSQYLEELYQQKYKKTLTLIYNEPSLNLVLYYSGPLLNWLEKNHPEYIAVLYELVNRKRIEVLSGPYYEPILPLLSISDTLGQIEKMTTALRKNLRKRSRGCWIPGSFWDQKLVSNLSNSGLNYCFLEESYFQNEGFNSRNGFYQTEDQGKSLYLFPINRKLSNSLLSKTRNFFKELHTSSHNKHETYQIFFPGEQIGEVSKKKWLNQFIKELSLSEIECVLPSDLMKDYKNGKETVYIKNTTVKQYKDSFRYWFGEDTNSHDIKENSHYKNYIANNPSINYVYGKSTYTSILINQIRGDRSRKKVAREYLWKGQNLFSYWNGEKAFLSSRQALHYLLEAEKMTREKGIFKSSIISQDLDNDGEDEFIFQGNYYNCAINTRNASIFQLDYLPDCWNYLYNEFGYSSFQERFLKKNTDLESILSSFDEEKNNICYTGKRDDKQIIFKQKRSVLDHEGKPAELNITKKIIFKRNWFTLTFRFENPLEEKHSFNFSNNIIFGLPSGDKKDFDFFSQANNSKNSKPQNGFYHKCSGFSLFDKVNNTDIQVDFNLPMEIGYKSILKKDWNNVYNLALYPLIHFQLYPKESFDLTLTFRLAKHR